MPDIGDDGHHFFFNAAYISAPSPPHYFIVRQDKTPRVQIDIGTYGVLAVRLCGKSWDDEPQASETYRRVVHLIREIDRALKYPEPQVTQ